MTLLRVINKYQSLCFFLSLHNRNPSLHIFHLSGIWREDLSNRINIGAPTDGYHRVQLDCNDNSISVAVVTENDFDGVIYTRGSFYGRSEKCFQEGRFGQTDYYFDFEFDECNVKKVSLGLFMIHPLADLHRSC